MPMRLRDTSGDGSGNCMADGLVWAADHGARVANISYSVSGNSIVDEGAKYFRSKGGVVTVSAGNGGTFRSDPDDPYLLAISANDGNGQLFYWSSYGNFVDLAAPGV